MMRGRAAFAESRRGLYEVCTGLLAEATRFDDFIVA